MTRIFTFLIALLLGVGQLQAQNARLQLIHNSPSPTVDIWVNGQPFETNFDFRTATAFQDVPAEVELEIGIAPSPSSSVNDIVETFRVTLDADRNYAVLAQGVLNDADRPFRLKIIADAREASTSNDKLDITVVHGGQDAPAVDVFARDLVQLVDGAAFDDNTPYTSIDPIRYLLDVKANDTEPIVATFEANLDGLDGGAAVVFASGYLQPDSDEPRFGIFAALPNGDVVEFPEVSIARAQIIHNAIAPTVDIWVNGEKFYENLEFQKATPYVEVPAGVTLNVGVAAAPSSSPMDIIETFPLTLDNGARYAVLAQGILNDDDKPFDLNIVTSAQERSETDDNVDFAIVHGSPDAPNVDIFARDVAPLAENLAFTESTPYVSVPADRYLVDFKGAGTEPIVATFEVDLSNLGGGAAVVFASGFLTPDTGQPAFGVLAALPNGDVASFPATSIARAQIIHNAIAPTVDIWVNGEKFFENLEFRKATPFVEVPADVELNIGLAAAPSNDPSDIIETFELTLDNGARYAVLAQGILNDDNQPIDLNIIGSAQERSEVDGNVDFAIMHGSPNAPGVDIFARDVAQLAENLPFTQSTPYIAVPADRYLIDIKAAGTEPIVATFEANLSTLGGGAAVVFASGFLNPDANQAAFGIFAALPNGDVATFPATSIAKLQIIHNAIAPTVDIWVNNEPFRTNLEFRGATAFVEAPADVELNVGLAAAPSTMPSQIVQSFPVTLENGENYIVTAQGILNDNNQPLDLDVKAGARLAGIGEDVDIMVVHGSPDAPTVDVVARGIADPLVDDLEFGQYADDYLSVPANSYDLGITPADDNSNILFEYRADVSTLEGQAITIFASGFVGDDPSFGLWVADANGNTFPLSLTTSTQELTNIESLKLFPNPVTNASATLEYELTESSDISWSISDYSGRLIQSQRIGRQPAGLYRQDINVSELPLGVYLLQFQTDAGIATQKIIVGRNN